MWVRSQFSGRARQFGGCIRLPGHLTRSQQPVLGGEREAPIYPCSVLSRRGEDVLSLGLSFLTCKVNEAARQCPSRVLSTLMVKVWTAWAQDADRYL